MVYLSFNVSAGIFHNPIWVQSLHGQQFAGAQAFSIFSIASLMVFQVAFFDQRSFFKPL